MDSKEIKPVHPKGNQPWIFIGRTDAEAEAPVLWLPDAKSLLIVRDPDAGKDGRQEKGATGKPGVLQSMESQRVGQNWATEVNWTEEDLWAV